MLRYLRLLGSLARFSLLGEMAFRGNYLLKVFVEVLWLALLLLFYNTIYGRTSAVGGWTKPEYLFFLGCYTAIEGLIETFVARAIARSSPSWSARANSTSFSCDRSTSSFWCHSVRSSGVHAQRRARRGVDDLRVVEQSWSFDVLRLAGFFVGFACAATMAYSFLIMLVGRRPCG